MTRTARRAAPAPPETAPRGVTAPRYEWSTHDQVQVRTANPGVVVGLSIVGATRWPKAVGMTSARQTSGVG